MTSMATSDTPAPETGTAPEVTETKRAAEETQPTEVITPASWGPEENPDAISLGMLQLAEFYGTQGSEPQPAAQAHLERLEDVLRSHGIGGAGRKSEGYYGPKTRELVQAAAKELLGTEGNGVASGELLEALRRRWPDVAVSG